MKKPVGLFSGFGAIALAATAYFGLGAHDPANAARSFKDCRDVNLNISADQAGAKAQQCKDTASTESDRLLSAIASYNAAKAYNVRRGVGDHGVAIDMVAASRSILNDDSLYAFSGKDGGHAQQLRTGRAIEAARAYIALGAAAKRNDNCSTTSECSTNLSNADKEFVKVSQPDTLSSQGCVPYYWVHADMNEVLGRTSDAIADLTKIASDKCPPAIDRLAALYTKSVNTAVRADPARLDLIRSALGATPPVLNDRPSVQVARGSALLKIATLDKSSNYYQSASDSFQAAINSNRATVEEKADGWLGKGEALLGLGDRTNGVKALQQSEALEAGKPARWVGLGSAYARAGDLFEKSDPTSARTYWNSANGYFEKSKQSGTGTPAERVAMLIKRAEVKAKLLGRNDAPEVITAYEDAINVDRSSPKPYYMVGAAYFKGARANPGNISKASYNLSKAIEFGSASRQNDIAPSDLAYAYHYQSMIMASTASLVVTPVNKKAWEEIVKTADAAADRGAEPIFASEACLIRIMRPSTFGDPSEGCRSNGSPESFLLQGMAYLKAANAPGNNKQYNFGRAEGAFSTGLALLQGATDTEVKFKTVRPLDGSPPSLGVLLEYGKATVPACYGARITTSLSGGQITQASNFFADHNVKPC